MRVKNMFNYKDNRPPTVETTNLPSMTVPSKVLTIEEILRRNAQGQSVTSLTGIYQESGDYNELLAAMNGMSEMERLEYARDLEKEVKDGLEKYKKDKKEREALQEKLMKESEELKIQASQKALEKFRKEQEKEAKKPS